MIIGLLIFIFVFLLTITMIVGTKRYYEFFNILAKKICYMFWYFVAALFFVLGLLVLVSYSIIF